MGAYNKPFAVSGIWHGFNNMSFSFTIQSSKNRVFYAMAWSDLVFRLVSWENMDKKGLFYDDDFFFAPKKIQICQSFLSY